MDGDTIKQKYPKSKHNKQCLGPCYEPGTWVINPITLQYITNFNEPFCPTNTWEYKDPITKKTTELALDNCYVVTHTSDISKEEIEMNILLPKIDFDSIQFLNIYYNIYSFEATLDWLDKNPMSPFNTKLRLIECSWKAYGEKLDIIDDRLIVFYQEIIRKRWIRNIYPAVEDYIKVSGNDISVDKSGSSHSVDKKDKIRKINYIVQKYATKDKIYLFLTGYIKDNKKQWDNILNHEKRLLKSFIDSTIKQLRS
jgi:hypothetical protein